MTEESERMLLELVAELLHVTNVNAYPRQMSVDALLGALIHHLSFSPQSTREYAAYMLSDFVSIQECPLEHRLPSMRAAKMH
jgi:hypothetical protein